MATGRLVAAGFARVSSSGIVPARRTGWIAAAVLAGLMSALPGVSGRSGMSR